MSLAIRFQAEPIRSLSSGAISVTYMGIGTSLAHPARQFYILNQTNAALMFSFDGINDHIFLPSQGYMFNDVASNQSFNQGWYIAEGTRIYVKDMGSPANTGSVYVSFFYGSTN